MLLGDFIKELKHKSIWIYLNNCDKCKFSGTMGELIHNVEYLNNYSNWSIDNIIPQYDDNFKAILHIQIWR